MRLASQSYKMAQSQVLIWPQSIEIKGPKIGLMHLHISGSSGFDEASLVPRRWQEKPNVRKLGIFTTLRFRKDLKSQWLRHFTCSNCFMRPTLKMKKCSLRGLPNLRTKRSRVSQAWKKQRWKIWKTELLSKGKKGYVPFCFAVHFKFQGDIKETKMPLETGCPVALIEDRGKCCREWQLSPLLCPTELCFDQLKNDPLHLQSQASFKSSVSSFPSLRHFSELYFYIVTSRAPHSLWETYCHSNSLEVPIAPATTLQSK